MKYFIVRLNGVEIPPFVTVFVPMAIDFSRAEQNAAVSGVLPLRPEHFPYCSFGFQTGLLNST